MKKQNKILSIYIVIIIVLFLLELNSGIIKSSLAISNYLKENISSAISYVGEYIDTHISQANEIERLKIIEKQKEAQDIEIMAMNDVLSDILPLLDINKKPALPITHLVKAYSYVNMGQYSQVWLESIDDKTYSENEVYGLIRNGYAAGIALKKDNQLLGILNGDSKLSYSVYIGNGKSIGVLKSSIKGVIVEYIYAWSEINVGDEIITSGLDDIFFEGVKVGKVKAIRQEYGYMVVDVALYNENNDIGYFWLVDMPKHRNYS